MRQKIIVSHNSSEIHLNQLLLVRFRNLGSGDVIISGMVNLFLTDSKLKGNFPQTKENAFTENTQISAYTQDFTMGPQLFNGQSDCTIHTCWVYASKTILKPANSYPGGNSQLLVPQTSKLGSTIRDYSQGYTNHWYAYPLNDVGTH